MTITLLALGFIILSLSSISKNNNNYLNEHASYDYRVEKVIDGDTIKVSRNGIEDTVRLLGINTPEISGPYRTEECYGHEASEYLKNILPSGSYVAIETDPTQNTRDQYERVLAYVIRNNGTHINQELISAGYAREYTYRNRPYRHQYEFQRAEQSAQDNNLGLWTACK